MRSILLLFIILTGSTLFSYELIYYEDFESYEPGEVPDHWIVYDDSISHIIEIEGNMVFRAGGTLDLQMPPYYSVTFLLQSPEPDTCCWTGFTFYNHEASNYHPLYRYFFGSNYLAGDGIYISDSTVN